MTENWCENDVKLLEHSCKIDVSCVQMTDKWGKNDVQTMEKMMNKFTT